MAEKVFISGSRDIDGYTDEMSDILKKLRDSGAYILVGDAIGADRMVQLYFKLFRYKDVTVYCSRNLTRNNLGNFPVKRVETSEKGRKFFESKDIAMSQDCDRAVCFWNGYSKGTKANIDRLKAMGKDVEVIICKRANMRRGCSAR